MNDMNPRAVIGDNNPPDPIDTITAAYDDERQEAENWTDGAPVENEGQMKSVDALRESMRQWRLELERGQKAATAPLREIYQAELDRWKPTIADAKRIEGCLVATVDAFKRKLAAQKQAEEKAAWEAANKARREAEEKARRADAANLEAQREIEAARQAAIDAEKVAQEVKRDQVKGMRTVTLYEVEDHRALLHWIATNRRDGITAFIDDWARRNHKATGSVDGLRVWQEKGAY